MEIEKRNGYLYTLKVYCCKIYIPIPLKHILLLNFNSTSERKNIAEHFRIEVLFIKVSEYSCTLKYRDKSIVASSTCFLQIITVYRYITLAVDLWWFSLLILKQNVGGLSFFGKLMTPLPNSWPTQHIYLCINNGVYSSKLRVKPDKYSLTISDEARENVASHTTLTLSPSLICPSTNHPIFSSITKNAISYIAV